MYIPKPPRFLILLVAFTHCLGLAKLSADTKTSGKPNIVLIMTDDQGWGQTGYYNHPALKTPNLDAMAADGLRFDRFYAASPSCSPTRASVLTGRNANRTGAQAHGFALRLQEMTVAQALQGDGYATGHFGKWHLNGTIGPGVPLFGDDKHNPGAFGFDEWLSVTNYFDLNPIMSRKGEFVELKGDSSGIIVDAALKFMKNSEEDGKPFFAVIWDGSPHSPSVASEEDKAAFANLDERSKNHYGELVAFDRAVGVLRSGLRELGVAENTLVWFNSDNGGLGNIKPDTVGGLKGYKGSVWEGGIRVPGIVEWPAVIKPRVTDYPASTMDIFPTIADVLNLPDTVFLKPIDGISLYPLFKGKQGKRETPIFFRHGSECALVDNDMKLHTGKLNREEFELFNLKEDPAEATNIAKSHPEMFGQMKARFMEWSATVDASVEGRDYPEGKVLPLDTYAQRHKWVDDDRYKPHFEEWKKRPEYANDIKKSPKKKADK